ncbi:MAG: hypothetical protein V2I51_20420 [Anderseniella sp.]|jgi:hypothetical protein|nr:hypothetical protein [Anderseniella sp.]
MSSKKTLNVKNLEALGAERLAELLIEISQGNAAAKRRLRLELAGLVGPGELAREIRKRLATIAKSRAFVDWHERRRLIQDLTTQLDAIVDQVAANDPAEALDLLWRFLDLAPSVFERSDDSSGDISAVFANACDQLEPVAVAAKPDPVSLAERVFAAIQDNGYGQYDDIIHLLAPALGPRGLEHLKALVIELSQQEIPRRPDKQREAIGWSRRGPIYADDIAETSRRRTVQMALQEIADLQGDVDAFIAQYDDETRKVPRVAAGIAQRLVAAGRAQQAMEVLAAARKRHPEGMEFEWEDARIAALDALERHDEAQAARWTCFERTLSAQHLKAYLKRLPDFDDVEAEARAFDHVLRYKNALSALHFLITWPAVEQAAKLIIERGKELDGNYYEVLTPAADALAGRYPLAATVCLRAMIDFTLTQARSSRYRHAARHLLECESLASMIEDYGAVEPHSAYVDHLKQAHGRKSGFWSLVAD